MSRRLLLSGALFASVLLSSCAKDSEPMPAPVYLLDQRWQLVEMQGQPVGTPGRATPSLELNPVGNAAQGRAFCSQYGGSYELTVGAARLRLHTHGDPATPCPDQDRESQYLGLLPRVSRYVISNRQLALYDGEHAQPILVYKATE